MSLAWSLTEVASHLLQPEEREVILGDLWEARESAWRGLLDVLSLAARRHLLLWKSWRPWLSGLGLALPNSFLLMGASVGVSMTYRSFSGPVTLHQQLLLISQIVLLAAWSWSGGFAVGKLSRQTLWASLLLCFAPCLFCLARFRIPSLPRASLLLFLLPAVVGAFQGVRGVRTGLKAGFALALSATAIMVYLWSGNHLWFVDWSLIWPAWYIVSTARQPSEEIARN